MSNADPPPVPPTRHRPHPLAYVLAVVLPLIVLAVLVVPPVALWADRARPAAEQPTATSTASAAEGQPGVGDPYFPDYGSSGYDVRRYRIAVAFDPADQVLRGTTRIDARSTQELRTFYVDLALEVSEVSVDGQPATFTKEGFQDVEITPAEPIAAGADFEVAVTYAGRPGDLTRGETTPWLQSDDEWSVVGEPEASAWWFPANDHPSDPALMDVSIRVPRDFQAISIGALVSKDTAQEADFDTWQWVTKQPAATYLVFLSVGRYDLAEGQVDGRPYVYAVSQRLDAGDRTKAMARLQTSAETVRRLEAIFGPYPFSEIGGAVLGHRLRFGALENQTRPVYNARAILDDNYAPTLITHEFAHMWFGDQVTLRQWNDIFNNEAYASWAEWAIAEEVGRTSANDRFNRTYDQTKDDKQFWQITMIDPGKEQLFSTVYVRGPMALQALRNVMGEAAFLRLSREWVARPGTKSLEEWMIRAQSYTTVDLVPFFEAWIFSTTAPERTAANGFR